MLRRRSRPIHRWRARDVRRAYLIGYIGTVEGAAAKAGYMAPAYLRRGAALFRLSNFGERILLWRYREGVGGIHAVEAVNCGVRERRREAEEEARAWAESAGDLDDVLELTALGTFAEFDAISDGLVQATLRSAPSHQLEQADAGLAGSDKDVELWDWDRDRPVDRSQFSA